MLQVELDRDAEAPPTKRVRKKTGATTEPTEETQKSSDLLIHAIPTEVLAPYTALIAGIVATIDSGESSRTVLRWAIYGVGFLAIALFLGVPYARQRATNSKRRFPVAGSLTAMLAYGAWGLVMPGSPLAIELSGDDLTIWTLIITIGGAFLVALMTQPLKKQAK